jgi:hypothetical protein
LYAITSATKLHRVNNTAIQIVVGAMTSLLDDTSSQLETRRFVLFVINQMPELLPAFFRGVSLPDMTRQPFSFASRLGCLSFLLRESSGAESCMTNDTAFAAMDSEAISLLFVPLALKKATLSKAILHSNHLIALDAVKLFCVIVGFRWTAFRQTLQGKDGSFVSKVSEALNHSLPNVSVFLTALSKLQFRPGRKADMVLFAYLCNAVRVHIAAFPTVIDWTKLLPTDASAFASSPVFVQRMILGAIKAAEASQNVSCSNFAGLLFLLTLSFLFRQSRALSSI